MELIDYSYDRFTPAEIKAAGKAGVIRYVAGGRPKVSATRAEVDGIRGAGLVFCAVWERDPSRALLGRAAGLADGADADAYCAGLGATATDPVFFAVDFDATAVQMPAVHAYVDGVAAVLGWNRVGVYGGLPVLAYLRDRTPLALFWQTIAWSGGQLLPYANLYQYVIEDRLNGKAVDLDRSLTVDYGQWGRMALKSSGRTGEPVLWVCIHTAEGPYDDNPANPSIDPGSVDQLRNFFADPNTQASCHAGADDDQLSDGWVPYDRAAWTLRNGNAVSDNLEMCGRAGWSRAQWLTHPGLIRNAARWAAGRCLARGIPARRLTPAQVAARNVAGIIDHNTYTVATGDGTHWDVGPGFPWDVFLNDVNQFMQGKGEDPMADLTPEQLKQIAGAVWAEALADGTGDATKRAAAVYLTAASNRSLTAAQGVDKALAAVAVVRAQLGDDEGHILGALGALSLTLSDEDVARLAAEVNVDPAAVAKAVRLDLSSALAEDTP